MAGVRRSEIEASVDEIGIKLLRLLEIFNSRVKLGVLERRYPLVEKIAGAKLAATRYAEHEDEDCGQRESLLVRPENRSVVSRETDASWKLPSLISVTPSN